MDEVDEPARVPLPRRASRPGASEIGRARERLYGERDSEVPSGGSGSARWAGVDTRERSAALARSATTRPPSADTAAGTPTDRPAEPDPGPTTVDPDARPGTPRTRVALAAAAVVAALALGMVLGALLGPAPRPPPAAAPPPSHPTAIGEVVAVLDGETVAVRIGDRTVDVGILGLDTPATAAPGRPAECGGASAAAYASDTLVGRLVTLVPDPSVDEVDAAGRRLAYVVLRTQQSYTDLALLEGIGRRSTARPLWYDEVFAREEATARAARAGIWGPPCGAAL